MTDFPRDLHLSHKPFRLRIGDHDLSDLPVSAEDPIVIRSEEDSFHRVTMTFFVEGDVDIDDATKRHTTIRVEPRSDQSEEDVARAVTARMRPDGHAR